LYEALPKRRRIRSCGRGLCGGLMSRVRCGPAGFVTPGVTVVFKRFFHRYCELQVRRIYLLQTPSRDSLRAVMMSCYLRGNGAHLTPARTPFACGVCAGFPVARGGTGCAGGSVGVGLAGPALGPPHQRHRHTTRRPRARRRGQPTAGATGKDRPALLSSCKRHCHTRVVHHSRIGHVPGEAWCW
jgi:hypothetical protein